MKAYIILVFLHLHCNVMRADINNNVWQISSLFNNHDIHQIPNECVTILDAFADYASNFTQCSIKHARPIRLCANCIEQYMNFYDKYHELLTTVVNGTSCKSLFISHDRLDAVLKFHDSITDVWEKGNCKECYDWSRERPELSDKTKTFNKQLHETLECIAQNNNTNNTDTVCVKCMLTYVQLDEFYQSLSPDAIGIDSICMDTVDSMNATRYKWSKVLNCCKLRKSPEIIFLCCTAIIAMLPFLFYVAVRFLGPIRDLPNVLKQSRFKQIILRSSNARIN